MYKKIKLTKGKVAIVDEEDFEKLKEHKWCYCNNGYAVRKKERKIWPMHWEIMGKPSKGMEIDHVNRNRLDNRRRNLRIVTPSQNKMNRSISKNNTSGYKGVCWSKFHRKWKPQIKKNRKKIFLGYFDTAKDAYKAYCIASLKYHGEFGRLK